MLVLKTEFEFIVNNYKEFYDNQKTKHNRVLDKEMKEVITQRLPQKIQKKLKLDENIYYVTGSFGMGNYTETPWISIFEKDITVGAQKGFYIVFLFRKDMTGFYLSLNQGVTYLEEKFKGNKPKNKIREVVEKLRNEITLPTDVFPNLDIDLKSNTKNAQNYAAANICSKYYSSNNLPQEEVFIEDIATLLEPLKEIKKLIGLRELDDVIDDLLYKENIDDLKHQEDMLYSKPAKTERKPKEPPYKKGYKTFSWQRDGSIAKEAIVLANYTCEIDAAHTTFISSVTGENYVEAHHLIPINQQMNFEYSLDVPGNIVALCPNCHREIHHANKESKSELIRYLLKLKKLELNEFGLSISLNELLKSYGIV